MTGSLKSVTLVIVSLLPWFVKKICYGLMGYKIEPRVKIGFGTIFDIRKHSSIGFGCRIGSFCVIKADTFTMDQYAKIASFVFIHVPKVTIGRDALISHAVAIRSGHTSPNSELVLGDLVHVFPYVNIDCTCRVEIQREAGIGPKCDIYTHSSYKSVLEGYPVIYSDVLIGQRVELTYSVFVAPGVTIGDDAICAYGSYVNKDVPAGVLVAGMPAVVKRTRDQIAIKPSPAEVNTILEKITENCTQHIIELGMIKAGNIVLILDHNVKLETENTIYILNNSKIESTSALHFAIFDVNSQVCFNKGINNRLFREVRKYLSRYGIRFITSNELVF